jgi:hypothetical protein
MITSAAGVPNIKTDASAILTLYSKKWNLRYWQTAVLPDITTSQYFDQLEKGDQVEITSDPTITFSPYENGMDVKGNTERLTLTKTSVVIDQAGFASVALPDVDAELSHLDLANKYMDISQREGQKYIDIAFFAAMVDQADSHNKGTAAGLKSSSWNLGTSGAGVAVNSSNIVKFVTSLQAVLQEQVATSQGDNWCVIPPWMHWCLMNSELKNAFLTGDPKSTLRTGFIGMLNGMKFYTNVYVYGTGATAAAPTAILAGNKEAIVYTLRLNKAEKWRDGNFQTLLQLLMVWGWKVVKPVGIVNAYAYKAAEQ